MNSSRFLLQKLSNFIYTPVRKCHELPEGIQYYGFTYYPRFKDFKDPPYEPSKVFLVRRIKSMRGTTKEERNLLGRLNVDGEVKDKGHINVVKNIPPVNAMLWKVKHLVEIRPIVVNGELPKDGDYTGTYLRTTGELIVSPKLKIPEKELEATKQNIEKTELKREYIRDYLKNKWLDGYSGTV